MAIVRMQVLNAEVLSLNGLFILEVLKVLKYKTVFPKQLNLDLQIPDWTIHLTLNS